MKTFSKQRILIVGIINIFIFLNLLSAKTFSQNLVAGCALKTNDTCVLVTFTGKRIEQTNYINCTIKSAVKGYFLVLEKSIDGEIFTTLEIKKGQVSPGNQSLLYSFIDDSVAVSTTYKIVAYKIAILNKDDQKYLTVSENLFSEFKNSILYINIIENETLNEISSSGE